MEPSTPVTQDRRGVLQNKTHADIDLSESSSFSHFTQLNTVVDEQSSPTKGRRCSKGDALLCKVDATVIPSADNGAECLVNHDHQHCFLCNSAVSGQ